MRVHPFQVSTFLLHILFSYLLSIPLLLHAQIDLDPEEAEAFAEVQERLEGTRLNPNLAAVKDLQIFPWISKSLARQIVATQKKSGPFRRPHDLLEVPGLSPDLIDLLEPYLSFYTPTRRTYQTRWRLHRPAGTTWKNGRLSQRSEIQIADGLTGFSQTERDPGESTFTDFWSGYLHLTPGFNHTQLLIGDFRPTFGHGLLFSNRSRSASGLTWANTSNRSHAGYRAAGENSALRGLLVTSRTGPFTGTLMQTRTARDATIDNTGKAYIRTSGRHVTPDEQIRKDALIERLTVLHLTGPLPAGQIGLTAGRAVLTHPLASGIPKHHRFIGIDWQIATDRVALYGEVARSQSQIAWLTGGQFSLQNLRIVILTRHYESEFKTLHGAPFSAYCGTNEWGLFLGIIWKPHAQTRIEWSLDRYGRLRPEPNTALPARGERFKLGLTHRLSRAWTVALTVSTQKKSEPADLGLRKRLRLRLTGRLRGFRISGWAEGSQNRSSPKQKQRRAAGLDLRLGRRKGFSLSAWANQYRTTDTPIYTLMPDVWDGTSLQPLIGGGKTAGIRLGWSGSHMRFSLRSTFRRSRSKTTTTWTAQVDLGTLH